MCFVIVGGAMSANRTQVLQNSCSVLVSGVADLMTSLLRIRINVVIVLSAQVMEEVASAVVQPAVHLLGSSDGLMPKSEIIDLLLSI